MDLEIETVKRELRNQQESICSIPPGWIFIVSDPSTGRKFTCMNTDDDYDCTVVLMDSDYKLTPYMYNNKKIADLDPKWLVDKILGKLIGIKIETT